ncbi:glycosyltransferase [Mycobacterium bohemicum]|uniref:Glycosyltransferase n=1 Tax=Mycobacterium bohemicum TaxID=56425 RepID=A0A1X1R375_MYCBE|nr:nucleotide disphospho-sugar-binding domain-containing protein [Mycobacterium bohemicum]MCV6970307.1 glycosyltransferase [Mycobacterium bohemicum]ORU98735.1 glycosyltransferase [Mycobacterium bohemicum]
MKVVVVGYGSRGDVEPCAAVARELQRRGHDVRMAVAPDRLALVEAAGLDAVAYGPDTRERMGAFAKVVAHVPNPISALPEVMEQLTRTWAAKSETLTSLAPGADVLLAGMNEQELVANVAERQGIPLAGVHFFPSQILSSGVLQAGMTREAANVQRRALGLAETTEAAPVALEIQAYEDFCLPGLADSWGDAAARRPFVGGLTLELPTDDDDEVSAWIAAGTPPICFGLGGTPIASPAETAGMIGAACGQLGERALICAGPNDFGGAPRFDHVRVVAAVNHAAVLPACRAAVHHGGAGTTAAGMRAGIPAVVLWLWLDQPTWAAALQRLGIGSGRPFSATTTDSLVADLRSILTPECAARAREVAARMTPAPESAASAADLVEGVAAGRRPGRQRG